MHASWRTRTTPTGRHHAGPARQHGAGGRRRATVPVVLAGLLGATVVTGATLASTPALATTPPPGSAGYLAIDTSSTGATANQVYWTQADGTKSATTQTLTAAAKCALSTNSALLGFTGTVQGTTGNKASYVNGSLGTAEKTSGTSCYQVNAPSESLTVKLAQSFLDQGILATSAFLDVELKQDAQIEAKASYGGHDVAWFELRSGSTIGSPVTVTPPAGVSKTVFSCNNPSDSGPDSGVNDNCRWPISNPSWMSGSDDVVFDTLTLVAVNGSFSLEGGHDGLVPLQSGVTAPPAGYPQRASLIELVDTLDCGESTSVSGSGDTPPVTVTRLGNADSAEPCVPSEFSLTNALNTVTFIKSLNSQNSAQFVITITWSITPGSTTALSPTQVDFGNGNQPLGWCPDPTYSGATLTGVTSTAGKPDMDGNGANGVQYACVGTQANKAISALTVQSTEQIYVLGDIKLGK